MQLFIEIYRFLQFSQLFARNCIAKGSRQMH